MKRKLWNITVKDNPNRAAMVMGDNDEFYTTDTEAYLVFKLEDKNFNPATAVLTLENRNDGSLKNETVDVVDGLIEWEMPQRYIEHFGNWQGQLVYEDTKDGQPELYTSAPFSFVVNAHIGDKKKPSLVEIENWEKFIREGTELIETWEDLEALREENERQRQANYQELLDTGVLQTNINTKLEQLEEEYAPKLTEVTAQLAQKANDEDVRHKLDQKRDKSTPVGLNDIGNDLATAIQGGTEVSVESIPRDDSVTMDKISFKKKSTNLYNNETRIADHFVNTWHGGLVEHDSFQASDFIKVEPETDYFVKRLTHYAFYDVNKEYITGEATTIIDSTLTSPAGARYLRFSWGSSSVIDQQVNRGSEELPFEPFYEFINSENVEKWEISTADIQDGAIKPEKTSFVKPSKNLFNKETISQGYYVNQTNGNLNGDGTSEHYASDFIEVKPGEFYTFSTKGPSTRYVFYTMDKEFIEGEVGPDLPIQAPQRASYIRFSQQKLHSPETMQLEQNTTPTSYEPFGFTMPNLLTDEEITNLVEVNLPSKLYAMVGQEMNIYFDNIINGRDTEYEFDVTCVIGQQFQNFYRVVPIDVGNYSIKIDVFKDNELVASNTSKIIVTSQVVGEGVTKKILKIGDSTSDNGNGVNKLVENFNDDVMSIQTIGARGTAPYLHEGRSGWTSSRFVSDSSPFWNPSTESFDFNYYLENNNLEAPDYVFINLGVNDMFSFSSDESLEIGISNVIENYNEMIENIQTFDSSIKVVLGLTIPPNYSQDAFGKAYNSSQNRRRYKRNNFYWVKEMITVFDNRETENIYLTPIYTNLDTRYNMGLEEMPVNARNPLTYTSPIGNGGVHPVESGYWQIADVEYFFLKSLEV